MADNNNVFILFEEIKTMLESLKSRLEELPKVIDRQQSDGSNKQDLSPIKDAVAETTKAQSEEIKGLLAKQWKAYAQLSTLTLQQLDAIKTLQNEQGIQQELQSQEHIHRHCSTSNQAKCFLSLWGWVCYARSPCGATLSNGNPNASMRTTP